jgi:hypothetical protein
MAANGRAGLQLIVGRNQGWRVPVVNELDLLHGETIVPVDRSPVSIDESNYAQLEGLHGGRNTIAVTVEVFGTHPALRWVNVLPGSGVYATPIGPADLHIQLPTKILVAEGNTTNVRVILRDTGDAARRAQLRVSGYGSVFRLIGARTFDAGTVDPSHPKQVQIALRGGRAGRGTLEAVAKSTGGEPEAASEVVVFRYGRSAGATLMAGGLIALGTLGAIGLVMLKPRNRH